RPRGRELQSVETVKPTPTRLSESLLQAESSRGGAHDLQAIPQAAGHTTALPPGAENRGAEWASAACLVLGTTQTGGGMVRADTWPRGILPPCLPDQAAPHSSPPRTLVWSSAAWAATPGPGPLWCAGTSVWYT